jgi:hypothetical protein
MTSVLSLLALLPVTSLTAALTDNVTFVGAGRCTATDSSGAMKYITGACVCSLHAINKSRARRCTMRPPAHPAPARVHACIADNNILLRTSCKAKCLEQDACVGYWYYSGALFSSCFLDGADINGTNAMVAALGAGWTADTNDPFGDPFCDEVCEINTTDDNKYGGHAECYKRVRSFPAPLVL